METVLVNLAGVRPRRETLGGRNYLVAPLSLIVPGVLEGSDGPLLYPEDVITNTAHVWNGIPIVVNHPVDKEGKHLSARTPQVYGDSIGVLLNAKGEGKLGAEGWFDEEKTRRSQPDLYQRIARGDRIELSTGLFTENQPAPVNAVHNGKEYKAVVVRYTPDHLAILPNTKGACSLDDGCGVNVNERRGLWTKLGEMLGVTHDSSETQPPVNNTEEETDMSKADCGCPKLIDQLVGNDATAFTDDDREWLGKLDNKQLEKLVPKEPVANSDKGKKSAPEEMSDEEVKNEYEKRQKKSTANNETAKAEAETTNNKETKAVTEEEWLAQAPANVREMFVRNKQRDEREKQQLIDRLVSNMEGESKTQMTEFLSQKPISELEILTNFAPQPEAQPRHNYAGAAVLNRSAADDKALDDALPLPTINWGENKS